MRRGSSRDDTQEGSPLPPFRQGGRMVQRFTVCTTFVFGGNIVPEQQRPPWPVRAPLTERWGIPWFSSVRRGSSRVDTREGSPLPPFSQGGLMVQRFTVCSAFTFGGNINLGKVAKAPLPKGGSARRAVGDSVALHRGSSWDDTREESPLPPL